MKAAELVENLPSLTDPSGTMASQEDDLQYDVVIDCDGTLNTPRVIEYDHRQKLIIIKVEGWE